MADKFRIPFRPQGGSVPPRPVPGSLLNPALRPDWPGTPSWLTSLNQPIFQRLQPPTRCATEADKVRNLQNHIAAIQAAHRDMMKANDKIDFGNRAIVVTGLIRDTCVGFLDLAASLVPGKAAQNVAKAGSTAVSVADSAGEILAGTADPTTIALRTLGNVNGSLKPTSVGGQIAQLKVKQFTNLAPGVVAGVKGDRVKAQAELQKGTINTLIDTVSASVKAASTAPTDKYARTVQGLGVVKAALNYNAAVAARLDTYLNDQTANRISRAEFETSHKTQIRRLEEALRAAQREHTICSVR